MSTRRENKGVRFRSGLLFLWCLALLPISAVSVAAQSIFEAPKTLVVITVERLHAADLDDAAFATSIPNLTKIASTARRAAVIPDADDATLAPLAFGYGVDALELGDLRALAKRPGLHGHFSAAKWQTASAHRRFSVRDPHPDMIGFPTALGGRGPFEWGYSRKKITRLIERGLTAKGSIFIWVHVPWAGDLQRYLESNDAQEVGSRRRAGLVAFDRLLGDLLTRLKARPAPANVIIFGLPGQRPGATPDPQTLYPLLVSGPLREAWPSEEVFAAHDVGMIAHRRLTVSADGNPGDGEPKIEEPAAPMCWTGARPGGDPRRFVLSNGRHLVTVDLDARTTTTSGPSDATPQTLLSRLDARLGGGKDEASIVEGRLRRGDAAALEGLSGRVSSLPPARLRGILLAAAKSDVVASEDLILALPDAAELDLMRRTLSLQHRAPQLVMAPPFAANASTAYSADECAELLRTLGGALAKTEVGARSPDDVARLRTRIDQLAGMGGGDQRVLAEAALARLQLGDERALVGLRRAVLDKRAGRGRERYLRALADRDPAGTKTLLEILLGHVDDAGLRRAGLKLIEEKKWRSLDPSLARLAVSDPDGAGARAAEILLEGEIEGRRAILLRLANRADALGARAARRLISDRGLLGSPWLPGQAMDVNRRVVFETPARLAFEREQAVYLVGTSPTALPLDRSELPRLFIAGRTLVPTAAFRDGDFTVVRYLTPVLGRGRRGLSIRCNKAWREAGVSWVGLAALGDSKRIPSQFALLGDDEGAVTEMSLPRGSKLFRAEVWWQRLQEGAPSVVLEATMRAAQPGRVDLRDESGRGSLSMRSTGGGVVRLAFPALSARAWRVIIAQS